MRRLFFDPLNRNCLPAIVAAHKCGDVEIVKNASISALDGAILQTDEGELTSLNSIVCFLLGVDPFSPGLNVFLLWEATILKPAVNRTGHNNYHEITAQLNELQERLFICETTLQSSEKQAANIIAWGDLATGSPIQLPPGLTHLAAFVKDMDSEQFCIDGFKYLSHKSSNKSASNTQTKCLQKQQKQPKSKLNDVKTTSAEEDEICRLEVEVSPEQMLKAQWVFSSNVSQHNSKSISTKKDKKVPLKRGNGSRNIFITSALPYVNNVPHLGNLIGSLLSANIFAIYCEIAGYNVLSICGTDEYGTATEAKALAEGLEPRQITDKYHAIHCEIYDWFDIHFDYFGRTSTPVHSEITQEIFLDLHKNGFITESVVEQPYCDKCSRFLADRFVEGVCPFCNANEARGDQCDACGKLINAVELIEPRCIACRTAPIIRSSNHLFLDLPALEAKVEDFIDDCTGSADCKWTRVAQSISRTWIRDGLKQRCITRDLKWGVPVPLKNFEDKVFYVWFDAPIGYISITANYTKEWRQWWLPAPDTAPIEYFQFMAKDNVPFHSTIFPACLIGSGRPYTKVTHLIATDYLNYEDKKFSKSRGVGVFGNNAKDSGIESNIWRFYLAYIRPESQDSTFSWTDFALKNNTELLNNLGNFINRPLMFLMKFFKSTIPTMKNLQPEDVTFLARVNGVLGKYLEHMESCRLREGIRSVLSISRLGNGYVQSQKPWVLYKSEDTVGRAGLVTGVACNVAALLGILLRPFMPSVSDEIFLQCGTPKNATLAPIVANGGHMHCLLAEGHVIGEPKPLFKKIEPADVQVLQKMKLKTLQKIIKYNPNLLSTIDAFQETLLHHAATGNAYKAIMYFESMTNELNTYNALGQTPFMTSCRFGGFESAALLMHLCNDINENDRTGCAPLHLAARSGSTELVAMLILCGAHVDSLDSGNCHPLHYAAFAGNPNMCSLLMRFCPESVMLQDFKGNTPLHVASSFGSIGNSGTMLRTSLRDSSSSQPSRTCFVVTDVCELATFASPNRPFYVTLRNDLDQTPEHVAGRKGHFELAAMIQNDIFKTGNTIHDSRPPAEITRVFYALCGHPGRRRAMYFWMLAISLFWLYPYLGFRIAGSASDFSTRGFYLFVATNISMWICYFKEAYSDPGFLPTNAAEYENEMRELFTECQKLKFRESNLLSPVVHEVTICEVPSTELLPIRAKAQLKSVKLLKRRLVRLCHTCGCVKPIRAKHCGLCNRCVRVMDHHCPVTDNCVGEDNRVWFLMTSLLVTVSSSWIGLIVINYWRNTESTSPWEIVTLCLLSVGWFMAINAVFMTVGNALFNLTTNELANWRRYEHFGRAKTGFRNPFNRGYWGNVVQFFLPQYYNSERGLQNLRSFNEDKMALVV